MLAIGIEPRLKAEFLRFPVKYSRRPECYLSLNTKLIYRVMFLENHNEGGSACRVVCFEISREEVKYTHLRHETTVIVIKKIDRDTGFRIKPESTDV